MERSMVVQLAGVAGIVASLALYVYDGVNEEIFVITVLGILAVSAPQAFEEIVDRWGGGE